jgi:predicted  nucleic acid-binding Zn-ribbon protein
MPKRQTFNEFVRKANIKFDGKFTYDENSYVNSQQKINITCAIHGEFKQSPAQHLQLSFGCPHCANNIPLNNELVDIKLADRLVKRIGDYVNSDRKILWQCLKCNYEWNAAPDTILNARKGCIKCGGRFPLSNEMLDDRLKYLHIKRVGDIVNCRTKVDFLCLQCSHMWGSKPDHILNSQSGCPVCSSNHKNESRIKDLFDVHQIDYLYQPKIYSIVECDNRRYSFDFFIHDAKIAIEYQGAQHYRPVDFSGNLSIEQLELNFKNQQIRDAHKRDVCKVNGIELIAIDGRVYYGKRLKVLIESELIPRIKNELKEVNNGV